VCRPAQYLSGCFYDATLERVSGFYILGANRGKTVRRPSVVVGHVGVHKNIIAHILSGVSCLLAERIILVSSMEE